MRIDPDQNATTTVKWPVVGYLNARAFGPSFRRFFELRLGRLRVELFWRR